MADKSMILHQTEYIQKILNKFNMHESKPASTPMDTKFSHEYSTDQAKPEDIRWYQAAIGSLLYAALGTRPDILFAVISLGRYASNPNEKHISAVKRVFRYLRNSADFGIKFSADSNSEYLTGYADSSYASEKSTCKSISGYVFYLANGPVTFQSKLQSIVAQSSTEAEYIALCNSAKEATFLFNLMIELGQLKQENIPIFVDNNGAIQLSKNPVYHARTKHINVRFHFIREKLADSTISVHYIQSKDQKADGLTKALPKIGHIKFLKQLNMVKATDEKNALNMGVC